MRILVTGAAGFIGSAVCARLKSGGHQIVGVQRPGGSRAPAAALDEMVEVDFARAVRPADWEPFLGGVDAVVNCAGVLQDGPHDSTEGVHVTGAGALFAACERRGVRRVVHVSAIGVQRGALTEFSRSKLAGDEALQASGLEWVILRPSVVLGRAAYGGSALIRGLAALPLLPRVPDAGPLQVVQLDDLTLTIACLVEPGSPSRVALDVAGPERLGFAQVVAAYREWLGWRPARELRVPAVLFALGWRLGDLAGLLGWRSPMRTTARRELTRGAVGDPGPWRTLTGIEPRSLHDALVAEPASVQERWFARLYLLKPLILLVLALFWIGTGIGSLGPGWETGVEHMRQAGAGALAAPGVATGALVDIFVGCAIAWRRTSRAGLYAALAVSLFYLTTSSLLLPVLWADPLGPLLKIFPIATLNVVALVLLEER